MKKKINKIKEFYYIDRNKVVVVARAAFNITMPIAERCRAVSTGIP